MVLWRAGVLLLIVWLGGCGTPGSVMQEEDSADSAIIVVPGYYGTKLAQVSDDDDVWLDAWEALFGRQSLRLPLPGLGLDGAVALRPHGLLQQITVIPLIYAVEGYGALLQALRKERMGGVQIVPFSYDWRLDLMEAVRELGTVVDHLRGRGFRWIAIVAHSMGGLITGYYLRYGAQDPGSAVENWDGATKVDAVVMAGVPFRGSMTSFRNVQYGVQIGWNRSLLEQKAVASFPATYYLLPAAEADVLLTAAHEPVYGMIREEANWKAYGWGLLKDSETLAPDIRDERVAYTSSWLRHAGQFSDRLLAPPCVRHPRPAPLLYLFARGHSTVARGVWLRPDSVRSRSQLLFNEDHFKHYLPSADSNIVLHDGDGSVTVQSSSLPAAYGSAFRVTTKEYRVSHEKLASAPEVLNEIVDFLARSRTDAGASNEREPDSNVGLSVESQH